MARYIITLDDNAQGVAITGGAILTQEELLAGKKRTQAIALGELACHFVRNWTDAMVKKHGAHAKAVSDTEDAIKRVSTPIIH